MSIESNTLTHIQEIYFDVCDQLKGESYKDMGYENKREMFEEFKWKLERIEQHFKQLSGETEKEVEETEHDCKIFDTNHGELKPYALMNLEERATWNHRAAQLMEKIGGGFASALALAYFRGDGTNQALILGAFGNLFDLYRNRAFEQLEHEEQAAQE